MLPEIKDLIKPVPIQGEIEVYPLKAYGHFSEAISILQQGKFVLITDKFSTGLQLLSELKNFLRFNNQGSFQQGRDKRNSYRLLSHLILLEVRNHLLVVKKAPDIGWLRILYADLDEFALSFPELQGLNSSWQWYRNGLKLPVFPHQIFPWFGCYFPTRFEHLELFQDYLKHYSGQRKTAIDVGAGTGILSFMLENAGFERMIATDNHPNALVGLAEEIQRKNSKRIELHFGDLFAGNEEKADLIVFNPPWLPAIGKTENLDTAIYFPPDLFDRFFAQSSSRLNAGGKIVIIFSNLIKNLFPQEPHPVEREIKMNGRFSQLALFTKEVSAGSSKTRRNLEHRGQEQVELWVLGVL